MVAVPTLAQTPVVCTEEARLCPDGSSVGRTLPQCAFAPCPNAQPLPAPVSHAIYPVYEISPPIYWDAENITSSAQARAIQLKQEIRQLAQQTQTPIWFHTYVNPLVGSWVQLECPPDFIEKIAELPNFGRATRATHATRRITIIQPPIADPAAATPPESELQ